MPEIEFIPPRWLLDWRCPHCGQRAVRWDCTTGGEDAEGLVKVTNVIQCATGHRRQVEGSYDTGGL